MGSRKLLVIITSIAELIVIWSIGLYPITAASINNGILWRSVIVHRGKLKAKTTGNYNIPSAVDESFHKMSCSVACGELAWCNLWCKDPSFSSKCFFYEMFIVGNYREWDFSDALQCYTSNPKDYILDSDINGHVPNAGLPNQIKELLRDGIFPFEDEGHCYWSSDQYDPWVKINLFSPKPIRFIRFVAQANYKAQNTYDVEIRAGNVNTHEGTFRDNPMFGYFEGPATASEMFTFTQDPPVVAQFITFQRISDRDVCNPNGSTPTQKCSLHFCHIEIGHDKRI